MAYKNSTEHLRQFPVLTGGPIPDKAAPLPQQWLFHGTDAKTAGLLVKVGP